MPARPSRASGSEPASGATATGLNSSDSPSPDRASRQPHLCLSSDLIGLDHPCRVLESFLSPDVESDPKGSTSSVPSLLLAGPESIGKRTTAIRLAQAANCHATGMCPCGQCQSCRSIAALNHPDVRLIFPVRGKRRRGDSSEPGIDGAMSVLAEQTSSFALDRVAPQLDPLLGISIEVIRHLREEMSKPPFTAPRRFFIILHAERMTTEAANAFLKSLEEPQHQTTSVLVSSTPSLLPDTIRSRCRLVRFPAVPAVEIQTWLVARRHVKRAEAAAAAEVANGAPGQALRYLDEPHEYLASPIVEFFADGEASESLIGATIESLAGTPLTTIVNSFLLLFNRALRHKRNHALVSGEVNDPAITRASSLSEDYLRRAIGYLFERLGEARIHTNRRLFLYTLLASLRRSS